MLRKWVSVFVSIFVFCGCISNAEEPNLATIEPVISQPSLGPTLIIETPSPLSLNPTLAYDIPQPTTDFSNINVSLKEELFFDWGAENAGIVYPIPECVELLFYKYEISEEEKSSFVVDGTIPLKLRNMNVDPFIIRLYPSNSSGSGEDFFDNLDSCLYGFPKDAIAEVTLYTPQGQSYSSQQVKINDFYYLSVDNITVVPLSIGMPYGADAGQWRLVAQTSGVEAGQNLEVTWHDLAGLVSFEILSNEGDCYFDNQDLIVRGSGYEPNMRRPLGIYYYLKDSTDGSIVYKLDSTQWVLTDNQGVFEVTIPGSKLSSGDDRVCLVVPGNDVAPEYGGWFGAFFSPGVVCYDVCP